jgi:glycosyltransferase involved in cell wall biosynthesis
LKKHEMHDLVLLAGPQSDIAGIMNALDLHILSSSGEAFGNVTVEAMACGVPAVVTSVGAGEQIVGPTGWVAPPVNVEALAHAIEAALAEHEMPQVWMQRQGACRSRIVEKFSLERMAEAYRSVWFLCQRDDSLAISL